MRGGQYLHDPLRFSWYEILAIAFLLFSMGLVIQMHFG